MAALSVGESGARLRSGALELESIGLEEPGAQFDLTVAAAELPGDGGLLSRWQYDRELFDRATIARLASQLSNLLAAVVADPEAPIAALSLLDPAARRLAGDGLSPRHGQALLGLLLALSRAASLREAANVAGLSYRHAWGLLGAGARALGAPLVDMQRGKGARLTDYGRKLLEADAHVRTVLETQIERLRREVGEMLATAAPGQQARLSLQASHDLALPLLARVCAPRLRLDIAFRGADECLAALARGECDLAGFHVADALPRAAAAAAAPLLEPPGLRAVSQGLRVSL